MSYPDSDNLQSLIQQAQADPEQFRLLYRQYFPRVYAYVAYRVGRKQDTEDVVSEIFVNVIKAFPKFDYRGDGSFTAWLFRIAHNQVAQFYRQNHQQQTIPLDELPEIESRGLSPDGLVLQKERFAELRELINELSGRRQEVLTLRFFGGLRNQEIAEVLGLDERTVASHLSRAIQDLKKKAQAELFEVSA